MVFTASGFYGDDRDTPIEVIDCETVAAWGHLAAAREYRDHLLLLSDEALIAEMARTLTKQAADAARNTAVDQYRVRARAQKAGQKGGRHPKLSREILSALNRIISADPQIDRRTAWRRLFRDMGRPDSQGVTDSAGKTIGYAAFRKRYWRQKKP